ncbi:hypothetical protein PV11_04445 [Exophiala sideris]|uniref:Calcofluor white hypersensitive protein n=1 Tax=Exophiala sideris TaxID=1016849 RepID=A0A0D1X3Y4_9EURO|nr:hypothetical protein PV11_04445 [Exophiala sideris]
MSNRGLQVAGLALAGGVGYYLYNAGGDPKVAEKKMEADAHRLSAQIKNDLPGSMASKGKEAEKRGEALTASVGREFDRTSAEAKAKLAEAEAKAKEVGQKASKEANAAIDKFDKTVEKEAAKAKSGISSWFGGK